MTRNEERGKKKVIHTVRHLSDNPDWESYDDDDELFVQELPKVELHVHLDGSFDPDFLWKYMKSNADSVHCLPVETKLPWDNAKTLKVRELVTNCETPKDFHDLCTCRGYRSLKEMLNCFEIFLPLVRQNLDLIEQLAFDFCQRQWEQNVVYTEVRYSPYLLAEGYNKEDSGEETRRVTGEDVYLAVTKGLRGGCHKFGITVNQILSAITWRPDWAALTVELAEKYRNHDPCAVVGIDVAAGEEHFNRDEFRDLWQAHFDMIQRARASEIPITLHAGESTDQALENIRYAMEEYGAQRIGHGYRVVDSIELMKDVKERGIHFEVCPTSSDETGGWIYKEKNWKEHPALIMLDHGLSISFNSDDPAVFHTSLAWQYRIAMAKMDLPREVILQANLNAVEVAFCNQEMKETLRQMIHCYGIGKGVALDLICNSEQHEHQLGDLRRVRSDTFIDRVYISEQDSFIKV